MNRHFVVANSAAKSTVKPEKVAKASATKKRTVKKAEQLILADGSLNKKLLDKKLWSAADKMRGAVDPSNYKNVVLGLLFLKYATEKYEFYKDQVEQWRESGEKVAQLRCLAKGIFYVEKESNWNELRKVAVSAPETLVGKVDEAFATLEKHNKTLEGVFEESFFTRSKVDEGKLTELMLLLDEVIVHQETEEQSSDLFGYVYEYFLSKFAQAEGKGEFYTPKTIVDLLAELIQPYKGKLYDPCCGSGGMFVQSAKYIKEHAKAAQQEDLDKRLLIYGQESVWTTYRLARMNLAMRGLFNSNLGSQPADTFTKDMHPDKVGDKGFDYVMANPPFNLEVWNPSGVLDKDPRWKGFPLPSETNANYAWILHIISKLNQEGTAAVLLASGSLTEEGVSQEIRKKLLEADLVEAILQLPANMFYSTPIGVSVWLLAKNKRERNVELFGQTKCLRDRSGEIFFMDLRHLGALVEKRKVLLEKDIQQIAGALHNWQLKNGLTSDYVQPGLCSPASLQEVAEKNYSLLVSNFVPPAVKDVEADFKQGMERIQANIKPLLQETEELTKELKSVFASLGFGVEQD